MPSTLAGLSKKLLLAKSESSEKGRELMASEEGQMEAASSSINEKLIVHYG